MIATRSSDDGARFNLRVMVLGFQRAFTLYHGTNGHMGWILDIDTPGNVGYTLLLCPSIQFGEALLRRLQPVLLIILSVLILNDVICVDDPPLLAGILLTLM